MKLREICLFALLALPAWPNACTLSNSYALSGSGGHWSGTGCTGGSYIPGNGDTTTLADGVTLTVDQNWAIGASGANGTTPAIASATSGQVVVAGGATVTARGDILASGVGTVPILTMKAGSFLVFDSSLSVSPSTTRYRVGDSTNWAYRPVVFNGTAGSHVTVSSVTTGGALPGVFQPSGYGLAGMTGSYFDFSYVGDASVPALSIVESSGYSVTTSLQHFTFDHSGSLYLNSYDTVGSFLVGYGAWTNPVGTTDFAPYYLDGPATFQHLATVYGLGCVTALAENGVVTFNDNYFGKGPCSAFSGSSNFVRMNTASAGFVGSFTGDYLFADITGADNPHWTEWYGPSTLSGNIFDSPDDVTSDSGEMWGGSTNAGIVGTLENSILLPTKTGQGNSELGSNTHFSPIAGALVYLMHNTWVGHTAVGAFAMQQTNEGGAALAPVTAMESNLGWSNGGPYCKVGTVGTASMELNPVTLADYNYADANAIRTFGVACSAGTCTSGTCPNSANSYFGNWSSATAQGPHDVDVLNPTVIHPFFADTTRNVATFDTAYLHNAAGAQWVTSRAYTVGQIVSDPKAGVYGGATVNYVCITAHTSGATTEPNVGASWRTDWQFASLTDISTATPAGTIITDGAIGCSAGCTYIQALVGWVKRGFTPQNPALWCSGHDGEAVGAVPFCANGKAMMGMLGSISGM